MRILLAVPLLLVTACNVNRDAENGTTTVSFDENTAKNAVEDAGQAAENIGGAIANDVDQAADKVGDVDVDVNVSRDTGEDHTNHQ